MLFDYYECFVIGLLVNSPLTVEFIDNCCPTFFLDGSPCPPAINRCNIASMLMEDCILPYSMLPSTIYVDGTDDDDCSVFHIIC